MRHNPANRKVVEQQLSLFRKDRSKGSGTLYINNKTLGKDGESYSAGSPRNLVLTSRVLYKSELRFLLCCQRNCTESCILKGDVKQMLLTIIGLRYS